MGVWVYDLWIVNQNLANRELLDLIVSYQSCTGCRVVGECMTSLIVCTGKQGRHTVLWLGILFAYPEKHDIPSSEKTIRRQERWFFLYSCLPQVRAVNVLAAE